MGLSESMYRKMLADGKVSELNDIFSGRKIVNDEGKVVDSPTPKIISIKASIEKELIKEVKPITKKKKLLVKDRDIV